MLKNQKINDAENIRDTTLHLVISEFPQHKYTITRLFYESTNFIEICEDYVLCLKSLKILKAWNEVANEQKISELQDLISELQNELLSKI